MATVDLDEGIVVVLNETQWAQVSYDLQFAKTRTADRHASMIRQQVDARHVSPVAPVPAALRETLAMAIGNVRNRIHEINGGEPTTFDYERADAVLAIIAPPVFDLDEVMRSVEVYGEGVCSCPGCREQSAAHLASIRAMLEGRDLDPVVAAPEGV